MTFPIDEYMMIYTYVNFETTLPTDEYTMIYPYRNFEMTFPIDEHTIIYTHTATLKRLFPLMNSRWYIHIGTFKGFAHWWTDDDIDIPKLFNNILHSWANYHTYTLETLNDCFHWWIHDDICTLQLSNDFSIAEHTMIYSYCNSQIISASDGHIMTYRCAILSQFPTDEHMMIYR